MFSGKTIGQLTYLSTPTPDTLIPVELSGITYYIYFSSITNNVVPPTPSILCEDLLTPTPSGQCQNPLVYLINQSITTWCVENPPFVACSEGQDSFDYILNLVIDTYEEENIIPPICTTGENPLEYIINEAIFSFNNQPA